MKLNFIIDKKYDLELVLNIGGFFISTRKKTDKNVIKRMIDEKYRKLSKYLRKTKPLYQESWDSINKEFFKITEKITGYPWKYKNYFCVLSLFYIGVSNWGGNKIARTWQENPYTMRKITAHELIISHIFTIFEKDFKKERLTNKQKWALAEISAWAITGLEEKMLKFWPWITEKEKYPLNHNYPELYNLQKALRPKYEKKKNFRQFLQEGISMIKK